MAEEAAPSAVEGEIDQTLLRKYIMYARTMVRPALQADGGDITLRAVVDGKVRVTLVGACSTCPSSIHTMKHGIERLIEEEFEDFRSLVQVDG